MIVVSKSITIAYNFTIADSVNIPTIASGNVTTGSCIVQFSGCSAIASFVGDLIARQCYGIFTTDPGSGI